MGNNSGRGIVNMKITNIGGVTAMRWTIGIVLLVLSINFSAQSFVHSSDSYKHVIITSEAIKSAATDYTLHDLVKHRTSNSMPSVIITTSQIYSAYNGRDNQEKIRNFIKDANNKWGAEYFLIAGKPTIVPVRSFFMRDTIYIQSDFYYAALQGDFNANGNNRWGEYPGDQPAQFADVYVGRIPARNAQQIANFVYKVITYENSPPNASYHTKGLLWTNPDVGRFSKTHSDTRHLFEAKENMIEYKPHIEVHPEVVSRMSSGNYGYFLGGGHGFWNMSCRLWPRHLDTLSNNDRYFFYTSISCHSGIFTRDDNFSERLLVHSRSRGAVAAMLNSHLGMPPYIVQLNYLLYFSYFRADKSRLGEILNHSRRLQITRNGHKDFSNYWTRWTIYAFNLFGDPAMPWRMKTAKALDAHFSFDENIQGRVADSSGNFDQGRFVNGVQRTGGKSGGAVMFDGQDSYIEVDHSKWAPMGNMAELSVMAWVKFDQQSHGGIVTKGKTDMTFALSLNGNRQVVFRANAGAVVNGSGRGTWTSSSSLPAGVWNHVAVTYDNLEEKIRFYINGKEDSSVSAKLYFGKVKGPLIIGKNFAMNNGGFNGSIDELRVYSRKKAADEIVKVMDNIQQSPYTIALSVHGSGSVTRSPQKASYEPAAKVTLTAIPEEGMVFSGWRGDLNGNSNPATVTMDNNREIRAYFTQKMAPDKNQLAIISAQASAEQNDDHRKEYSFDGDTLTRWANDNTSENNWIIYDLGQSGIVSAVRLMLNVGETRAYPLKIEVGESADSFAEVWNGDLHPTIGLHTILVTEAEGRYVRLSMTGNNSDGSNWFSIFDIQVWGAQSGTSIQKTALSQTPQLHMLPYRENSRVLHLSGDANWSIYSLLGAKIGSGYGAVIDLRTFSKGMFLVRFDGITERILLR